MEASPKLLCLVVVIFWMVIAGSGQQSPGSPGTSLPCVQKLLPCQPYLKQPSNPPPSCCIPLKQLVVEDPKCLCEVFNDPALLHSLNITKSDALQLSKNCDANADISVCKSLRPPTTSPSAPTTPSSSSSNSSSTNSPPKSGGFGVTAHFGVSAAAFAFLLLLVLPNVGSI